MIGNVIGSLFSKVVNNAEGILDKVITTDKERDEAKLALKSLLLEAEKEAFAKEVEDRKSARDMYKDDAFIQKVLATLFTAAYFGLSFMMFKVFVVKEIDDSGFLFFKNLETSSALKCWLSAADPPLPQKIIFFFSFNALIQILVTFVILFL